MANVDLADWTKTRLEELIEQEEHKSFDSAVRSLLLRDSSQPDAQTHRWQSHSTLDLIRSRTGDISGMSERYPVLKRIGGPDSGVRMKQVTDVFRLNSWHPNLTTVTVSHRNTYSALTERLGGESVVVDEETDIPLFGVDKNESLSGSREVLKMDFKIAVDEVLAYLISVVEQSGILWKQNWDLSMSNLRHLAKVLLTETGNGKHHNGRVVRRATLSEFNDILTAYSEDVETMVDDLMLEDSTQYSIDEWSARIGTISDCIEDHIGSFEGDFERFDGGNDIEISPGEVTNFEVDAGASQESKLALEALICEIFRQARLFSSPTLLVFDDIVPSDASKYLAASFRNQLNHHDYQISLDYVVATKQRSIGRGESVTEVYRHDPSNSDPDDSGGQKIRSLDSRISPNVVVEYIRLSGGYETEEDQLLFTPYGEEAAIAREAVSVRQN